MPRAFLLYVRHSSCLYSLWTLMIVMIWRLSSLFVRVFSFVTFTNISTPLLDFLALFCEICIHRSLISIFRLDAGRLQSPPSARSPRGQQPPVLRVPAREIATGSEGSWAGNSHRFLEFLRGQQPPVLRVPADIWVFISTGRVRDNASQH